jgi:hypothetical protein
MRIVRLGIAWICLLVLCSCATKPRTAAIVPAAELPSEVAINKNAGRWGLLFVKLRLESGEEIPVVVDTGSSWTVLDKSLQPGGERLKTVKLSTWNTEVQADVYPAPRICLGSTPLMISNVAVCDLRKMSFPGGAKGVLGIDCLKHYCVQLDFETGKMRFLNSDRVNVSGLGEAFPLTLSWNLPFIYRASFNGGESTFSLIDTGYDIDGRVENRSLKEKDSGTLYLRECVWGGESYTNLLVRQGKNRSVVGLRFLARHLVTFNFPKQTMYLKQRNVGPLLDEEFEDAMQFLKDLKEKGQQPGWSKQDKGSIWGNPHLPWTLDVQKNADSSVYHYSVSRTAADGGWKLKRAWRTDENDRTVEEYAVPEF